VSGERAQVRQGPRIEMLLESLPYIREFSGHTIVIKYGGAAMADESLREAFANDIVLLKYVGLNPVIVHGGGPEITDYMQRLGLQVEFVQGLRVSDEQTVEVAKMVLIRKLNKDIVLRLNRHGQAAVGLCGDDGSLFQVTKRQVSDQEGAELDLGFVGSIRHVDVDVLNHIAEDYIPVVASVGADAQGRSYNVNADEAAGAVAGALGAYKVIFLTDVEGWLADRGDPASLVSETDVAHIRRAIHAGEVAGGMLPKLQACADAVAAGVTSAHIVDGREPHSLLLELFTDAGIGTKVVR
jgi:acetylglutamate kinase